MVNLDYLAKLFNPFHTKAGKQCALALVEAKFINPDMILALPASSRRQEPDGEKPDLAQRAALIVKNLLGGMVSQTRGDKIERMAREESKPFLLMIDATNLGKAYEADKSFYIQNQRLDDISG